MYNITVAIYIGLNFLMHSFKNKNHDQDASKFHSQLW